MSADVFFFIKVISPKPLITIDNLQLTVTEVEALYRYSKEVIQHVNCDKTDFTAKQHMFGLFFAGLGR